MENLAFVRDEIYIHRRSNTCLVRSICSTAPACKVEARVYQCTHQVVAVYRVSEQNRPLAIVF